MTSFLSLVATVHASSPIVQATGDGAQLSALTAAQQGAFAGEFARAQALARDGTTTEEKLRLSWTARFRKLQPAERFEE